MTLIKSVAQAIPVYTMTAFQFPKNLCEQLNATIRRFWWNPKSKFGSYWTPISWSSLFRPQKEGGLGFRQLWDFNQVLLSKLAWCVLFGKDCLCIEVLRAKYKVYHNWLNQAHHSNASLFGKVLLALNTYYLKRFVCWWVMVSPLELGQTRGSQICQVSSHLPRLVQILILL